MLAKANQEVKRLGLKVFLLIVISCMFTYFSLYTFETVTFKDSKILQLDNHISLLFNDEKTGDSNKKENSIKTGDDVDPIRLVSVSNIYIDPKKSFVFYEESQQIAWTSLIVADQKSQIPSNKINVLIKQGDRTVFNSNVDPFQRQIYSNKHYTSYVASFRLENANLTGDKNDKTPMRYQIIVDGKPSEEYPVLFVRKDHMTMKSTRTARLIKCIWMPSNVKTFEYIIQLIIDCKYDSIYVCVFRKDEELKKILTQFDSKQKIKIIELENLPNAVKKGTEINHFFEVFEDRVDSEMFDPALEFLLNMVYPLLVNKYRYVHAADYDHIVFSHNLTMYERIQQVIKANNAPQDASLYFNQYWALDNLKSQEIFQNVQNYLNQISVTDLEKSDGKITYPVDLKTTSFDLRLNEKKDFIYAIKILKLLNENKDSMYRYVTFKFQHMYIYGQTIHNTKSSLLIKLCEAGMYFTNGQSVTVSSPHSIHYREDYNFNLLKVEDRYLPMSSFVLSNDFEKRK